MLVNFYASSIISNQRDINTHNINSRLRPMYNSHGVTSMLPLSPATYLKISRQDDNAPPHLVQLPQGFNIHGDIKLIMMGRRRHRFGFGHRTANPPVRFVGMPEMAEAVARGRRLNWATVEREPQTAGR